MGPGAALEREEIMLRQLRVTILATGGAILAPLCALGHGLEFITAKLTLLPEATVQLEVTADYAGNPLVADERAARAAIANPLHVRRRGDWVPLDTVARPTLTAHSDWASCAPPSLPPTPPEAEHALVTATWRWQHADDFVSFAVPKGNMHDVFLWQGEAGDPSTGPKWMLLLAGDVTKELKLKSRRGWMVPVGWAVGSLLAVGWFCWMRGRRRLAI